MKSIQNLNDSIGNLSRKLLGCSTVSQPTAPPRALLPTTYPSYTTHRCQAFNRDLYSAYIQETRKTLYICTSTLGTLVKRTSTLNSIHYTSEQSSHISGWNRNSGGYEQQLLEQYSRLGMRYVTVLFIRQTLRRETMLRHHEQTCRVF